MDKNPGLMWYKLYALGQVVYNVSGPQLPHGKTVRPALQNCREEEMTICI